MPLIKKITYQDIENLFAGEWITAPKDFSTELQGAAFDTRKITTEDIFFAWKGENSDGHLYLQGLFGSDVKLIIVEKKVKAVGEIPVFRLENSLSALQILAKFQIENYQGKVVNITGSAGKTTTKTWLKQIVGEKFITHTNPASFNNHIGCPVTILNMPEETELLILEMGMSGLGEIMNLTSIAPSDIAVLLNVGSAHIGKLGSKQKLYDAKMEITANQKDGGVVFLPGDDDYFQQFKDFESFHFYGTNSDTFQVLDFQFDDKDWSQKLLLNTPFGQKNITIQNYAHHAPRTLSACFCVAHQLGLSWEEMESAASTLPVEKGRGVLLETTDDSIIYDDSYNANPESVLNMLQTIARFQKRNRVAIIGNLAELGDLIEEAVNPLIENFPVEITDVFLFGESSKIIEEKLISKRLNLKIRSSVEDFQNYIPEILSLKKSGSIIGVKGSRSSQMEKIVLALDERFSKYW